MQAYEFYAIPKNGVIPIPDQYKNKITARVKVILLEDTPLTPNGDEANIRCKSDLLLPPSMSTVDWKLIN